MSIDLKDASEIILEQNEPRNVNQSSLLFSRILAKDHERKNLVLKSDESIHAQQALINEESEDDLFKKRTREIKRLYQPELSQSEKC